MSVLPDNLGDLIRLAVKDLEACEADPMYVINLETFHVPLEGEDLCEVGLAGAVIAKTLQGDPNEILMPLDFNNTPSVMTKLRVLNTMVEYSKNPYGDDLNLHLDTQVLSIAGNRVTIEDVKAYNNLKFVLTSDSMFDPTNYDQHYTAFTADLKAIADLMDKYDVHYTGA